MDKILLIIGILSLILISGCSQGDNYEIVGNSVMVNDSNIFMLVTPHTIQHSDWVELEFESKIFSGNADIAFGFDTTDIRPKKIQYYNPHNVTVQTNYTCEHEFNYTTSPNFFTCYNEENSTLIFEHSFDGGSLGNQMAWWDVTHEEKWSNWAGAFNSIEFEFDDKNTWWYNQGQSITSGETYIIRYLLEVNASASPEPYKYDIALKPSSESIEEAIQNDHFYFIDPWIVGGTDFGIDVVAYWNMDHYDEASNDWMNDTTGNGYDLEQHGTVSIVDGSGHLANATYFDGTYVGVTPHFLNNSYTLGEMDEISWCAWLNVDLTLEDTSYGYSDARMQININHPNSGEASIRGKLRWALTTANGGVTAEANNSVLLEDAGYTFFCGVYNGVDMRIYQNTTNIGNNDSQTGNIEAITDGHLRINGDFDAILGVDDDDHMFPGHIDEFGIWNRTLTISEITTLFNNGIGVTLAGEITSPTEMTIDNLQIAPSLAYAATGDLNGSAFIYNDNGNNYNVTINWTNSTNFLTQSIQTAKTNGTHSSFNLTGHSFTVGEVINLTMFAVEQNNESINLTSSITITILDTTPTWSVHPNNQTINHSSNISLQYTCTDPDGAPYYDILNFTGNLLTPLTINSTGYIGYDPNVTETGTYDYNVTCGQNNENISQVLNITILNNIPTIPNNLSPDDNWSIFGTAVNLTCANGTDIDEDLLYYEFWGNISTNNFDLLQNTTSATYNWTGLTSGLDYNWNCRAYDTYNYSGFTTNRTIIPINFTDCVGDQNVALNFTYQNEDNGTALTETFKSNLQLENQDGDTSEVLFDLSTNTNHRICLDNDNQSITINTGMIEYVADSHDARNYYFWNATIQQNVTNNIILYSLQTDLASGISITVEDDSGVGLEERIVYVERYNVETNTYKLIAMGRTGDDGQDVIFLRGGTTSTGDAWYRFKVYYEGELLLTTLPQKIIQSTVTLRIGLEDYLEHVENIEDVGHTLTYNETTRAITATFSTASGLPRNVCLQVVEERPGAYIYNKYDECLNTASGVLTYTHDDTDFTYHAYVYSSASAKELLEVLNIQNITDNFGTTGVFISALLVIILITIGTFSPVAAVIFGTLGIIGANAIGILTVGQSTIISIVALALIIIIRIGRGGR